MPLEAHGACAATLGRLAATKAFLAGVRDSGPVCTAFSLLFLSIGTLSAARGLSSGQAVVMTASVFAAPLQAALLAPKHGFAFGAVLTTSIIVNFRFSIMAAALAAQITDVPLARLLFVAPMLSASSFTVSHTTFQFSKPQDRFPYFLGVAGAGYIVAVLATWIGATYISVVHSRLLDELLVMILPIHFTALTSGRWPKRAPIFATALGFLMAPLAQRWAPHWGEVISPLLIAVVLMASSRLAGRATS